jgi:hypothetical protein
MAEINTTREAIAFEQVQQWVKDPLPSVREGAYCEITRALNNDRLPYSAALYRLLHRQAQVESSEELKDLAAKAEEAAHFASTAETKAMREMLDEVLHSFRQGPPCEQRRLAADTLSHFIWNDYHQPTQVVYLGEDLRLGDSEAVMDLISFLGVHGFPEVQRVPVPQRGFCEDEWNTDEIPCYVLIARPSRLLPSEVALRSWMMPNARYGFPDYDTPRGPRRRWPLPDYHCVIEQLAPGVAPIRHEATYRNGRLEDYGIVQVYTATIDGRSVRVIVCAGATRLGTHAAVYLATKKLALSHAPNNSRIPAPRKMRNGQLPNSLEIFFRTWTVLRKKQAVKSQFGLEILDLRAGRQVIPPEAFRSEAAVAAGAVGNGNSPPSFEWGTPTAKNITLFHPTRQSPSTTTIDAVWIDGWRAEFKFTQQQQGEYEVGRLLIALALHKQDGRATVSFETLANDTAIWRDGKTVNHEHVVGQLKTLRTRYLGDALVVDDRAGTCTLKANVLFRGQ